MTVINEDFTTRSKFQDIGRWYVTKYVQEVAASLPARSSILDAGAGEGAYKKYFGHCDYKAIDLGVGESKWNYTNLDYIAPLDKMPIENDSFDSVLCTQVLEHLELPRESVREMFRVLKPGGRLFLTVPMAQGEHQTPYDFFRYTSFGLRSICKDAGFSEITIKPFGGLWVRWAYEIPNCLTYLPSTGIRQGRINGVGVALVPLKLLIILGRPVIQRLFVFLDRFDIKKDDPFGWSCEARK
jgi:SAM-dependent methyltransferase